MQTYSTAYQKVTNHTFAIPINCSGVGANNGLLWFYFPNNDMVQADIDAIDANLLAYKYGRCTIIPNGADTYTVTIETTQASATPTLNGVALELMNADGGIIGFNVESLVTFTIGSDLDMEDVIYVIY